MYTEIHEWSFIDKNGKTLVIHHREHQDYVSIGDYYLDAEQVYELIDALYGVEGYLS